MAPDLSLPVDIPWKRLGASADMIDTTFGDGEYPPKWRSSVAVFYHEPEIDESSNESYCDRRITYLKIACSITGYQLDQREVEFGYDSDEEKTIPARIAVRAKGTSQNNVWPKMVLRVNGQQIEEWDVDKTDYQDYEAIANVVQGNNTVEVFLINGSYTPGRHMLFIESLSVGAKILSPTDPGVSYMRQRRVGRFPITTEWVPGQSEMPYYGKLHFTFDYEQKDEWMSQLIEEYDNIGAYLPCYGAILHVAVFPNGKTKEETKRECVSFSKVDANRDLPQVYKLQNLEFRSLKTSHNKVVSDNGNLPGALDLQTEIELKLPAPTTYFAAKIYHSEGSTPVTLETYKDGNLIEKKSVDDQPNVVHTVVFQKAEVDRVVFKAPQNNASLTEICYDEIVTKAMGLEDYPYIMAFEPQKREMYETVTESGESLSRSLDNINVRKGFTSTTSNEVVDIDRGGSFGFGLDFASGAGINLGGSSQKESGTRNINTSQSENIATTDTSRESRETASHSTTLSQMYHLFSGYHLGTNRALFFMLPRPHVTEVTENGRPARTFVKGLRRLEGVQEIFLVVNRPKSVSGICVDSLLETAHLGWEFTNETEEFPTEPVSHSQLARFLTEKYGNGQRKIRYYNRDEEEWFHHVTEKIYWHPGGILSRCPQNQPGEDHYGDVAPSGFRSFGYREEDTDVCQDFAYGSYEEALAEYYEANPDKVPPSPRVIEHTNTDLILTARSVSGCLPEFKERGGLEKSFNEAISNSKEWVSFETQVQVPVNFRRAQGSNQLIQAIGQKLQASLGSRERYQKGEVDFMHSKYVINKLKGSLIAMPDDDPNNMKIKDLPQLDQNLRSKFHQAFPEVDSRKQALSIPLAQLREKLAVSNLEARDLHLRLMGIMPKVTKSSKSVASSETVKPTSQEPSPKVEDSYEQS